MLHALTIAARPSGGATCQVIRLAGLVGVVLDGLRQCVQAGGSGLQGLRLRALSWAKALLSPSSGLAEASTPRATSTMARTICARLPAETLASCWMRA